MFVVLVVAADAAPPLLPDVEVLVVVTEHLPNLFGTGLYLQDVVFALRRRRIRRYYRRYPRSERRDRCFLLFLCHHQRAALIFDVQ